jgi:hypothetical protein
MLLLHFKYNSIRIFAYCEIYVAKCVDSAPVRNEQHTAPAKALPAFSFLVS